MGNNVSENPREQHPTTPQFVGERVKLGDVVEIEKAPDPSGSKVWLLNLDAIERDTGNVLEKNMVKPDSVSTSTVAFTENAILYSTLRPNLNKVVVADEPGFATSEMLPLVTKSEILDRRYLAYLLRSKSFVNLAVSSTAGAKMPRLSKKTLLEAVFTIPDLKTQYQRVRLLASIEKAREKTGLQVVRLDSLVKSRFVEMFGDLRENREGWPVEQFDSFAIIDTHMITDLDSYAEKPHIGIDSIESISGRLSGYRTVAEDGIVSGKYPFTNAHIIYSKIRPALNKVALPDFDGVCSADAYPILPVAEKCNRVYLAHVLRSDFFLDHVLPLSGRAQMPKVNKKALRAFSMPLPPLTLQQEFADFVSQVDKLRFAIQQQIDKLETLKNSLMQEYFE